MGAEQNETKQQQQMYKQREEAEAATETTATGTEAATAPAMLPVRTLSRGTLDFFANEAMAESRARAAAATATATATPSATTTPSEPPSFPRMESVGNASRLMRSPSIDVPLAVQHAKEGGGELVAGDELVAGEEGQLEVPRLRKGSLSLRMKRGSMDRGEVPNSASIVAGLTFDEKTVSNLAALLAMDELNAATVNANGTAAALTKAAQNTNGRSVQRPGPSTQTTGQAGLLFERMRSFQAGSIAIDEDIKKLQSMQRDDADAAAAGAGGKKTKSPRKRGANTPKSTTPDKKKARGAAWDTKSKSKTSTKSSLTVSTKATAEEQPKRTCVNCGRSNTPQWRIGPDGPKTLCNACGVHYRKFKALPNYVIKFGPNTAPVLKAPDRSMEQKS